MQRDVEGQARRDVVADSALAGGERVVVDQHRPPFTDGLPGGRRKAVERHACPDRHGRLAEGHEGLDTAPFPVPEADRGPRVVARLQHEVRQSVEDLGQRQAPAQHVGGGEQAPHRVGALSQRRLGPLALRDVGGEGHEAVGAGAVGAHLKPAVERLEALLEVRRSPGADHLVVPCEPQRRVDVVQLVGGLLHRIDSLDPRQSLERRVDLEEPHVARRAVGAAHELAERGGLAHVLEQLAKALLARAQRLLGKVPVGHVGVQAEVGDVDVVAVEQRRDAVLRPEHRAVLAPVPGLAGRHPPAAPIVPGLLGRWLPILEGELAAELADELVDLVAEHLGEASVDERVGAVETGDRDALARVLDDRAVALLAFLHRLLGPLALADVADDAHEGAAAADRRAA